MIEIIFLGTSAMAPTKERNHSSIFFKYKEHSFLFDCGEGTQRQLKHAGLSAQKISNIFISHWHGDHVLGLPGMMQTMASNKYVGELEIMGPNGTAQRMNKLLEVFPIESPINFNARDVLEGVIVENSEFRIIAKKLAHSIECIGFRFEEKDKFRIDKTKMKLLGLKQGPHLTQLLNGKTISNLGKKISPKDVCFIKKGKCIAYIADTGICESAKELAKDSDLVICESTYASKHVEKTDKFLHLTSEQAAMIASQSNAKELILTHFSQRYNDISELLNEARCIFPNTKAAFDLMKIKL